MKRDTFRHVLAATAVAGAAFVLSGLIPFCDSHDDEERARASAHRAFVAALEADPETQRAADAAAAAAAVSVARERADKLKPLLPPAKTFAQDAIIRAAQRDFLSGKENWPEGVREQVQEMARSYDDLKWEWRESIIDSPDSPATAEAHEKAMRARFLLDKRCADLALLTPEARTQWDAWEAKNWQGWAPQLRDPEIVLHRLRPEALVTVAGLRLGPALLEQREYLDDLANREAGAWPGEDAGDPRSAAVRRMRLADAREDEERIGQQIAEAARNEAKLRARIQDDPTTVQ